VRGVGASKADAFEQAALALTAAVTDPASVVPRERVQIECAAADDEALGGPVVLINKYSGAMGGALAPEIR
jgi:SHS2 domain-containing protein